jgi:hypothetical protein
LSRELDSVGSGPVSRIRLVLGGAFILSAITLGAVTVARLSERRRVTDEVSRLRDDLYRARVSADRCQASLTNSQSSLSVLRVTIDSLKSRIDSFEALGDGHVPADKYAEYLQMFDAYNDSVGVWGVRSDRLRTAEASCRDVIARHNALSDSIQAVLDRAGISAR